LHPKLVMASL